MTAPSTPELLGLKDFADFLGVRPSYVTALKKGGRLVLSEDGKRVRVAESVERIEATRDPARADVSARHAERRGAALPEPNRAQPPRAPVSPTASEVEKVGSSYQTAKAVKEKYLALSARRDYEISIGKLLPIDQVTGDLADALTTLRTSLEILPDTLAPSIAGESDETRIRNLIADEIERALGDLARSFTAITATEKATA